RPAGHQQTPDRPSRWIRHCARASVLRPGTCSQRARSPLPGVYRTHALRPTKASANPPLRSGAWICRSPLGLQPTQTRLEQCSGWRHEPLCTYLCHRGRQKHSCCYLKKVLPQTLGYFLFALSANSLVKILLVSILDASRFGTKAASAFKAVAGPSASTRPSGESASLLASRHCLYSSTSPSR